MAFVIPTYFRAVDQYSAPVAAMQTRTQQFANSVNATLTRTPTLLSDTSRQLLSVAKQAALFGGILFSAKSIGDYEKAVAKFRVIVSDLSDKDFQKFKVAIGDVAKETKSSSVDVANAFENIAGITPEFAKTTASIKAVTSAAITLSRAAGSELGETATVLTTTLNQYSLAADQADRTINVLAAGQAVGAASITQVSESLKNFGATAKGANISLEQSVALVEALASKGLYSEEAGTGLKSAITHLQVAGLGYKSGLFNFDDALDETNKKLAAFSTAKQKDDFIMQVFGLHQLNTGRILLETSDLYKKLAVDVTGTTEATKAAAIQQDTLYSTLGRLKDAWVTYITTNDTASKSLNVIKSVVEFVSNNLDVIIGLAEAFIAVKVALFAVRTATLLYNVVTGIAAGLTSNLSVALSENAVAAAAETKVIRIASAATWLFTEASTAAQVAIGASVLGLIGLIGYFFSASTGADTLSDSVDKTVDSFTRIKKPIEGAVIALQEYNKAVDAYNTQQSAKAILDYRIAHGTDNFFKDIPLAIQIGTGKLKAPEKGDYFDNPNDIAGITEQGDTARSGKQPINLNVNVDKSGAVSVTSDGIGITPVVTNTSKY